MQEQHTKHKTTQIHSKQKPIPKHRKYTSIPTIINDKEIPIEHSCRCDIVYDKESHAVKLEGFET